jgi:hypothetical protein
MLRNTLGPVFQEPPKGVVFENGFGQVAHRDHDRPISPRNRGVPAPLLPGHFALVSRMAHCGAI